MRNDYVATYPTITYIEGACISEHHLHEFSIKGCMEDYGLSVERLVQSRIDREDNLDECTDVTVQVQTNLIIVSIFSSDGEVYFYIGLKSDFIGCCDVQNYIDINS